jgi:hypothetical protein
MMHEGNRLPLTLTSRLGRELTAKTLWTLLGVLPATLLAACGAASDGEPELEEPVTSEKAALVNPAFKLVIGNDFSEDSGVLDACPWNMPHVLSLGFIGDSGMNDVYFQATVSGQWDAVFGRTSGGADLVILQAMCSNAPGTLRWSTLQSDGDASASCASGEVAVGGGAFCTDSSAALYRTRPDPGTSGSVPTGWRASCTEGSVRTYAMCRDKDTGYDFTDCKIDKHEGNFAACDAPYVPVSVGGFCGDGQALAQVGFPNHMEWAFASCHGPSDTLVNTYAICCRRQSVENPH